MRRGRDTGCAFQARVRNQVPTRFGASGRKRTDFKTNYKAYSRGGATVPAVLFSSMKYYVAEIRALSSATGEMTVWAGPIVPGISFRDAQAYCENNGLGYCRVTGLLVAEIPCFHGTIEPDMSKQIDYDNLN